MEIFADLSKVVMLIGILAFIVSVITEVTKKIEMLDRIPTALQVIAISLLLCPVTMLGLASYYGTVIEWYMVFASFIAAFVVALVSMDGWERLAELYKRYADR